MTQIALQREAGAALEKMRQAMLGRGDAENAGKLAELKEKWAGGKCALAFCGHFSAGKSSLINALCGAPLLPAGPVPTSANLVIIENGEPAADVVLRKPSASGATVLSAGPGEVWSYGLNGEEVERIRIRYPVPVLAGSLQLLDTPGVDSTDEAHREATESALHLADVVLYVTDYNHVLSEMNFAFLKRLQDWGKPLYLIVNQVDKHDEGELPFAEFRRNIGDTLTAWGISPRGVLFVSVKHPGHPLSEWGRLLWLIERLGVRADDLRRRSVLASAAALARAHVERLFPAAELEEEGRPDEEARSSGEEALLAARAAEIEAEQAGLAADLEEIVRLPEREREKFRTEAEKLIENAILMPAPLRDEAERYLESRKPGFRAGLFASRERTRRETETRLKGFADRYCERVQQHLIWHLNELLASYARKHGVAEEAIGSEIVPVTVDLSPERIASEVNEAAGFTREYVMTYTSLLADRVKKEARRDALDRFAKIEAHLLRASQGKAAELQQKLDELRALAENLAAQRKMAQEKREYLAHLLEGLAPGRPEPALPNPADAPDDGDPNERRGAAAAAAETAARPVTEPGRIIAAAAGAMSSGAEAEREMLFWRREAARTADRMETAAEALADIPSAAPVRLALAEKADRLRQSRFTVALFGAFSAGKSSLANALIGEPALPVSPNPTTAAVTTIRPPEKDSPHMTARVRMKSEEEMLSDILFSLSMLGLDTSGLPTVEAALEAIRKLDEGRIPARGKPHYSFLRAALSGWPEASGRLGGEFRADAAEYRDYVANERKSCFVAGIDLYCRSPLSEYGIVLVDTPGADSIHARHTGVAFDFIKNADAIVYVTYYNHAFSQADRQFLAQLGRVKDSFELDKMFFIVNAADLADSAEELGGVLRRVGEELSRHGVRGARLFPVSSRMALKAKMNGDAEELERSGLAVFERAFAAFAAGELLKTAVRSGEAEIEKAAAELRRLIGLAKQSEQERREQAAAMREAAAKIAVLLDDSMKALSAEPLRQEIRELLHYAAQRCMYRFGDWYNDAFHPSALQDGAGNTAEALRAAWRHLVHSISVEISQETLATSLRIERFILQQAGRFLDGWNQAAAGRLPGFAADIRPEKTFPTPQAAETLDAGETPEKTMRRWFKNARSFFEGGGKDGLRGELETIAAAALRRYVETHEALLAAHYEPLYAECLRELAEAFKARVEGFVSGYEAESAAMRDVRDLERRLQRIANPEMSGGAD